MPKITFNEWKNSMSFMIDDNFDNAFLMSIEPLTRFIVNSSHQFADPNQLLVFLSTDEEITALKKLKAFISLIGLSEERLKCVVSLVRYKFKGEDFKSEWDVKKISNTIQANKEFREMLVEFFMNGRNSKIGQEIPLYYMRNFKLTTLDLLKICPTKNMLKEY